MGQKVHPIGFRLSVKKDWLSKWYADKKNFPILLMEDVRIRQMLKERLSSAAVSRIIIERPSKTFKVTLVSAKPGVVIGKKGEEIEKIKADIQKIVSVPVHVVVEESKNQMLMLSTCLILLHSNFKSVFSFDVLLKGVCRRQLKLVF